MTENLRNYVFLLTAFVVTNILLYLFSGKYEGDKAESSLIFQLFNVHIHIHHCIIGIALLILTLTIEQYFGRALFISFLKGVAFGLIVHGIGYYNDYFKIIK